MLIGDLADHDYERFQHAPIFGGSDAEATLLRICSGRSALVLEDEPVLAGRVVSALQGAGFGKVVHVTRGHAALAEAAKARFDVLIFDRDVPDMDGLNVAAGLRRLQPSLDNSMASPILILTMLGSADNRLEAYLSGVRFNDYVAKADVNWEELLARVTAQIAMHAGQSREATSFGLLNIDAERRRVDFDGIDLPLKNRAFDIMLELMRANGRPITRQMLWQACWQRSEYDGMINVINVALTDIRKRIRGRLVEHNATAGEGDRVSELLLNPEAFLYNVWNRGLALHELRTRR